MSVSPRGRTLPQADLQENYEWRAYAKQMRPLVRLIENKILTPTDFSPMGGTTTAKSLEGLKAMEGESENETEVETVHRWSMG